jgi:hypothetical protein
MIDSPLDPGSVIIYDSIGSRVKEINNFIRFRMLSRTMMGPLLTQRVLITNKKT